jgi:transcriptional regulator with XRE-family HTH domain
MSRGTPKPAANYLRAWRKFRRLSQSDLGDLVGTTAGVISELETGHTQLSDKWLRRLAPALNTTPGRLLDYKPEDIADDLFLIADEMPAERREEAARILRVIAGRR